MFNMSVWMLYMTILKYNTTNYMMLINWCCLYHLISTSFLLRAGRRKTVIPNWLNFRWKSLVTSRTYVSNHTMLIIVLARFHKPPLNKMARGGSWPWWNVRAEKGFANLHWTRWRVVAADRAEICGYKCAMNLKRMRRRFGATYILLEPWKCQLLKVQVQIIGC